MHGLPGIRTKQNPTICRKGNSFYGQATQLSNGLDLIAAGSLENRPVFAPSCFLFLFGIMRTNQIP